MILFGEIPHFQPPKPDPWTLLVDPMPPNYDMMLQEILPPMILRDCRCQL